MMSDEMDEIWALYADDGAQSLDAMETALTALERADALAETGHVSALFRAVHTFKGNSRVLGLAVVESRAHLAEDLIGLVRDEGVPLDIEIRQLLLLTADVLRTMLEATAATHADVEPEQSQDLMTRLADKIARCRSAGADPAVIVAEELPPARVTAAPEPEISVVVQQPAPPVETPAPPVAKAAAVPVRRLADDPVYRDIFNTMAADAMTKLRAALARFDSDSDAAIIAARGEADSLGHAARQMGLDEWSEPLALYIKTSRNDPDTLAELILCLEDLSDPQQGETSAGKVDDAQAASLFEHLREPLSFVARYGPSLSLSPDRAALAVAVEAIRDAIAKHDFVRVVEAADLLLGAETPSAYQAAELRLYEELSAVEAAMPEAAALAGTSPRKMLESWCADNVFETLIALDGLLDRMRTDPDRDGQFANFDRLMRLVFHACSHFKVDSAAQLAMSLVDLFSRKHATGAAADPILIHIARRFVETVELVFDAVGQGDNPDTGTIERLFVEAANACFVSGGLMSKSAIEKRLGLPPEFHRVLSPESVRAASAALGRGLRFFVIRTDINEDERLAEAFLDWISTGDTCAITNVTVFQGNLTLFDFLIATPMNESDLTAALFEIDPEGRRIHIGKVLKTLPAGDKDEAPEPDEGQQSQPASVTSEMLETISEISAGQAMVNHMLTSLAETDLSDALYTALRTSGQDWDRAREDVGRIALAFSNRVQEIALAEAQLSARLAQLQQETVAIRSRPASTVLRPLETFVGTRSRRNGQEARLTSSGGSLLLDLTLLDSLRKALRSLVTIRLDQTENAPRALHIALFLDEERILVTIEDDGGKQAETAALTEYTAALRRSNGDLRAVPLLGGGMRFHLVLPLSMVVLEGMVVGVDGVRYVVPVESIRTILQRSEADTFRISAAQGQKMIRISPEEIVAVHSLKGKSMRNDAETGGHRVYVVLASAGQSVAIPVDELVGQQLVLLRPLRGVLTRLQHLTGLALLGGGDVGLVLSANRLCAAAYNTDGPFARHN